MYDFISKKSNVTYMTEVILPVVFPCIIKAYDK